MTTESIFNGTAPKLCPNTLPLVLTEMTRVLFLTRIAQVEMSIMGKATILDEAIRRDLHRCAETMRQFDQKLRARLPADENKWLSAELSKDKLFDINQLVELCARISNDTTGTDYEAFISMVVNFLDKTLHLQVSRKTLDMKKYKALMDFLIDEMTAEANGAQTCLEFDGRTLSFKLIQPENCVPNQPTIT